MFSARLSGLKVRGCLVAARLGTLTSRSRITLAVRRVGGTVGMA